MPTTASTSPTGQGSAAMDPKGVNDTIDPDVDVLRVDKVTRASGGIPIGAWSNFADHGTVIHSEWRAYSGDHHAAAWRVFSRHGAPARPRARRARPSSTSTATPTRATRPPASRTSGPAAADWVGTQEALAMVRAWKHAGRHLSRTPALDLRWTRTCFCGRDTATGKVDTQGARGHRVPDRLRGGARAAVRHHARVVRGPHVAGRRPGAGRQVRHPRRGQPAAGGPDRGRAARRPRAGRAAGRGDQGGGRADQAGARRRRWRPNGVRRAVIAGLADDYVQYITTREEYGQQSYEGASTLYGKNEGTFFAEQLADLAQADGRRPAGARPLRVRPQLWRQARRRAVPGRGRPRRRAVPAGGTVERLGAPVVRRGRAAPSGHDLPADRAFVSAQRRDRRGRWHTVDTDLGLDFVWRVDDQGRYDATWEVPLTVPTGTYRFRVTAARYALTLDAVPGRCRRRR